MRKQESGVTLIELAIVIAIIGVIFGIGPLFMKQMSRYFIISRVNMDLLRQTRATIGLMTRNIKQAKRDSIVIDRLDGSQPYYSYIRFARLDGTLIKYYQSGHYLIMEVTPPPPSVLTIRRTLIDCLRFIVFAPTRSDDLNLITVRISTVKNIYEGQAKNLNMASAKINVMN